VPALLHPGVLLTEGHTIGQSKLSTWLHSWGRSQSREAGANPHLQYVEGAPHVSSPQPYQGIHAARPQLHPASKATAPMCMHVSWMGRTKHWAGLALKRAVLGTPFADTQCAACHAVGLNGCQRTITDNGLAELSTSRARYRKRLQTDRHVSYAAAAGT